MESPRSCANLRLSFMGTLSQTYSSSIATLGFVAALMFVQVLISDALGLLRKKIPGTPVEPKHSNPLFRTSRTVANTNETIAIFICALLFCMLSSASPTYTAYAAWTFVISRALYAVCYYADIRLFRSVVFGVSLFALAGMIAVGILSR